MSLTTELVESFIGVAASAPSAHNTQPWVPEITSCTPTSAEVTVRVDPARTLPYGDPRSEDLHLSMGCWVESLRIAAAEAGVRCSTVAVHGHGPTLVIGILLTRDGEESDRSADAPMPTAGSADSELGDTWPLFTVADLRHRQVDRGLLEPDEAGFAAAIDICRTAVADSPLRLVEVPDRSWRGWLRRAALHSYGNRAVFAETLSWLRFDPADPRYHQDGLTADCLRIPEAGARTAALFERPRLHPWIAGIAAAALAPAPRLAGAFQSFAQSSTGSRLATAARALRDRITSSRPGTASAASDQPKPSSERPKPTSERPKPTSERPKPRGQDMHPHHVVLAAASTPALSAADEVAIGQILLRIWLTLDRHGLRVAVHSELKDSPDTRAELSAHLHHECRAEDTSAAQGQDDLGEGQDDVGERQGQDDLGEGQSPKATTGVVCDRPIAAFSVGTSATPVPRAPRLLPF